MRLKDSFKESGIAYDKVRNPAETLDWALERFKSLGSPVLEEIKRIDKGRLGIPVYVSRYAPQASLLTGTKKQMGKGATEDQAKASAVMELAERYSLFQFVKNNRLEPVPYNKIPEEIRFQLDHLLKALHINHQGSPGAEGILNRFPHLYAMGMNATELKDTCTPFSWMWPINEYNGSAAGNSLEEASVQAICEVVERHVCSVISYDRLKTPTIDLESIKDEQLNGLIQRFRDLGIHLILKDFSLDIGIPTVGAIAWDPSTYPQRSEIVYTAGTSTSPVRAAIRAITEVAQLAGDFDTDGKYLESGLPKFSTLEQAQYVLDSETIVPLDSLPDCSSDNFFIEVQRLTEALKKAGMPVYLIDITHKDLGVPAVYAMIPGNHFRDRTRGIDLAFHMSRIIATGGFLDPFEAMDLLSEIELAFPNRFDTAFYLGHLHEETGQLQQAIQHYNRALELNPPGEELASIHCHLGNCYRQTGELDKAVKELLKARELNSSLKEIHNLLGNCYYQLDRYMDAIECFEAAIAIDPGSAIDYANIGSNLRKLGMYPAAINWYKMALELDPTITWAREHLAQIENNDLDKAVGARETKNE